MLDMLLAQFGGFDLNGVINSLIGNPLVGAGLGWMFGGPFGALAGGLVSRDLGTSFQRNEENASREDRLTNALNSYTESINGIRNSLPAYQIGGQVYGNVNGSGGGIGTAASGNKGDEAIKYAEGARPGGAGGQGVINFDELFTGPQDALNAYTQNLPNLNQSRLNFNDEIRRLQAAGHSGEDLIRQGSSDMLNTLHGSLAATGNLFGGARLNRGDLISQVDLPDTDLSSVLAGRLAGLGEASRTQEDNLRESMASQAATFGGLENLKTSQDQATTQVARARGLQSAQETADVRQQELAAQEFVAGLQGQLSSTEAQINASLASEQARQENLIRSQISGTQGETAQLLAQLGIDTAGGVNALSLGEQTANSNIELGNINRGAANASILSQLHGAAGNANTQRTMAGLDALFRGLGFESNLSGNLTESELALGNIFANAGLLGNNDFLASDVLASIFPGRFGGGNGGGGGGGGNNSGFNVDLGTAVGTGAAALGTAAAGSAATWGTTLGTGLAATGGFCVEDSAILSTPDGGKTLAEIKVGDEVKNNRGQWRKVKRKEYIFPIGSGAWTVVLSAAGSEDVVLPREAVWPKLPEENCFVRLSTASGSITTTKDHVVAGKPAGDWKEGDTISWGYGVVSIEKIDNHAMMACGDIELEDGSQYMANGFPVSTMLKLVEVTDE